MNQKLQDQKKPVTAVLTIVNPETQDVQVTEVTYKSINAAHRATGVTRKAIRGWLDGKLTKLIGGKYMFK